MTIAGALARASLNSPTVPLTSASLAEWISGGKTKAGNLVSEARVHGLPAYYRAMAIRSGVEAMLPLKVYRNGTRERITQRTVIDLPNPSQTSFAFRQTMKFNEIAWGNAFARKVRNGADVVTQVWPMHPSRTRIEAVEPTTFNPEGKVFLFVDRHGVEHRWTSWDVLHVPFMSPDGLSGISAFQAFRESLGISIAAEDSAGGLFASGNRVAGILQSKNKLTKESAERLKGRWREARQDSVAGDIAVLDNDTEFKAVSIPPLDAQLLQSRQWSVSEISRMVGVLPFMIGDSTNTTTWGSGIEHQFIGWTQTTIAPSAKNFEEIVTVGLLPGGGDSGIWYAEHSLEGLLRGDSAARASFYAQGIQWGWLNRNEVRALENREPAEGLDEFLTPSNMTLITFDGKAVPLAQGGDNAPSAT